MNWNFMVDPRTIYIVLGVLAFWKVYDVLGALREFFSAKADLYESQSNLVDSENEAFREENELLEDDDEEFETVQDLIDQHERELDETREQYLDTLDNIHDRFDTALDAILAPYPTELEDAQFATAGTGKSETVAPVADIQGTVTATVETTEATEPVAEVTVVAEPFVQVDSTSSTDAVAHS